MKVPFNKITQTKRSLKDVEKSIKSGYISGDHKYTKLVEEIIRVKFSSNLSLLTSSCTASLEIAALLSNIKVGDEVIMPSFTFSSTANAFVLRGAKIIFVDINMDNLNINEKLIIEAISPRTKAIVLVHYAGTCCDIDIVKKICIEKKIILIEDAAQSFNSFYKNKPLGTIGDFGAISFHESKNITCGEGGLLFVNKTKHHSRAKIIREKGTNRSAFFEGTVKKYNWVDIGSSFLMSDINAAFLKNQIEISDKLTKQRVIAWEYYLKSLTNYSDFFRLPKIMNYSKHNGHIFYIILNNIINRDWVIKYLKSRGIVAHFHYIPLHSSPFGKVIAATNRKLTNTETVSKKIIRLPIWSGIKKLEQDFVIENLIQAIKSFLAQNNN